MSSVAPTIAVIGRNVSHRVVTSVEWSEIATFRSLDDFGVVVLDLTTLDGPHLSALNGRVAELTRFLFAPEGRTHELLLVGWHPWLANHLQVKPQRVAVNGTERNQLSDGKDIIAWLRQVHSYEYGFKPALEQAQNHAGSAVEPLADTNAGQLLAVTYRIKRSGGAESVPITFLPPLSKDEAMAEAIRSLILTRYALDVSEAEPEWLGNVAPLPHHAQAINKVGGLSAQINELRDQLEQAVAFERKESRWRLLLYEQGEPLERCVREALSELGAEVEEPQTRGEDDGRMFAYGHAAALEIKGKGRGKQIGRGDIRQLDEWVEKAQHEDGSRQWTGLLVSNTDRREPLNERGHVLAPNAAALMTKHEYAHVTTVAIFEALRQKQAGNMDAVRWWKSVFG